MTKQTLGTDVIKALNDAYAALDTDAMLLKKHGLDVIAADRRKLSVHCEELASALSLLRADGQLRI